MNCYEFIFAFRPDLTTEEVDVLNNKIQSYINDNNGKIENFENWGLTKLAYPIENYFDANYYLCKMTIGPKFIFQLKEMVRLTDKVLRYNFIKIQKDFSIRKKRVKKYVESEKQQDLKEQ